VAFWLKKSFQLIALCCATKGGIVNERKERQIVP